MVYGIDMEEKISPEERLLRLIRGKRQAESSKQQVPAPAKPCIVRRGFASEWIKRCASLKFINQLLFIFLFILLVYLGLDSVIIKNKISNKALTDSSPTPPAASSPLDVSPVATTATDEVNLKPYSYYSEEVEKRELFNSAGTIEPEGSKGSPNLEENLANLNLVGIVYAANPQTIIEEKKTNKTYFLNKGDYIGQFKVESILPGKVILTYDGRVYELNL